MGAPVLSTEVLRDITSLLETWRTVFMPGCGTEICRDRVDNSQKYTCQKENLSKKTSISRSVGLTNII